MIGCFILLMILAIFVALSDVKLLIWEKTAKLKEKKFSHYLSFLGTTILTCLFPYALDVFAKPLSVANTVFFHICRITYVSVAILKIINLQAYIQFAIDLWYGATNKLKSHSNK